MAASEKPTWSLEWPSEKRRGRVGERVRGRETERRRTKEPRREEKAGLLLLLLLATHARAHNSFRDYYYIPYTTDEQKDPHMATRGLMYVIRRITL